MSTAATPSPSRNPTPAKTPVLPQLATSSLHASVSPSPVSTPASSGSAAASKNGKNKPMNIFSNDGSFLERFNNVKKEDEEKRKHEAEIEAKRQFEDRFKRRGKKRAPLPDSDADNSSNAVIAPVKKAKIDEPTTIYGKQVQSYAGSGNLKDTGAGVRSLVK